MCFAKQTANAFCARQRTHFFEHF